MSSAKGTTASSRSSVMPHAGAASVEQCITTCPVCVLDKLCCTTCSLDHIGVILETGVTGMLLVWARTHDACCSGWRRESEFVCCVRFWVETSFASIGTALVDVQMPSIVESASSASTVHGSSVNCRLAAGAYRTPTACTPPVALRSPQGPLKCSAPHIPVALV